MSPVEVYIQNMVESANPIRLVIMLYDKAISCIEEAIDVINAGLDEVENVKIKAENLTRAMDILIVLKSSLNHEQGKEIAENLEGIYDILIDELVRANIKNDTKLLEDINSVLKDLREAWEEAEKKVYGKEEVSAGANER